MKKIIFLLLAALICISLIGCSFSGSVIQISSNGVTSPSQKVFTPESDSITLRGRLSVIGSIDLKILAPDGTELYAKAFVDVRNEDVMIELSGLTAGTEYTLDLNREHAVSCDLSLTSEQKLVADVTRPAKPEK